MSSFKPGDLVALKQKTSEDDPKVLSSLFEVVTVREETYAYCRTIYSEVWTQKDYNWCFDTGVLRLVYR